MLSIEKKTDGAKLTFVLGGRLDTGTSKQLDKEIEVLPEDVTELTFDLTDLEYLSSSGLRVLLTATKNMSDRDGKCVMCNVPETVMEVFEMTGLLNVFTIA